MLFISSLNSSITSWEIPGDIPINGFEFCVFFVSVLITGGVIVFIVCNF